MYVFLIQIKIKVLSSIFFLIDFELIKKRSNMNKFGDTIRELRTAQDFGLRETAGKIGISPAYLSRIERGKENPPSPKIIKNLAKILAADPDVLFRHSSSTDPEVTGFLHNQPEVMNLLRFIIESSFTPEELKKLINSAKRIKKTSSKK